jgi:hypothetical protein
MRMLVLARSIALEGFKPLAGWCTQEVERLRCVQLRQLALCDGRERPELGRT